MPGFLKFSSSEAVMNSPVTRLASLAPLIAAALMSLPIAAQPGRAVAGLEVDRFAGTWYEVARLHDNPASECASDVTSHYQPLTDGTLKVTSSCRTLAGRMETDVGDALPIVSDARHASQWKLLHGPRWLQWLPWHQDDLWVVMLDPDYRYAVTSDSQGRKLRVLSRNPALPADSLGRIVDRLTAEGYPTWQLVLTRQSAALTRETGSHMAAPPPARPRLLVQHTAARAQA